MQSQTDWESAGPRTAVFCLHFWVFQLTLRFSRKVLRCRSPIHLQRAWECASEGSKFPKTTAVDISNLMPSKPLEHFLLEELADEILHQHIHETDLTYQFLRVVSSPGIPTLQKSRSIGKHCWLASQLHDANYHWKELPGKIKKFWTVFYSVDLTEEKMLQH